jgi:hypothetical protein
MKVTVDRKQSRGYTADSVIGEVVQYEYGKACSDEFFLVGCPGPGKRVVIVNLQTGQVITPTPNTRFNVIEAEVRCQP